MTNTGRISIEQARRIAIEAQLLNGSHMIGTGPEAVATAIERLGYVQIDTISIVERAHHHTLWSRCPDYSSAHIHDLQAVDRRIFEYWAHALAYLPMADYRYYIPRMMRMRNSGAAWFERWKAEHGHLCDEVLARIRAEGPLTSKDFEPPPGTKHGTWWDWKPAKRALEILFRQGHLMIPERRSFQKVYDLTERVLPARVSTTQPSDDELARFHVTRALGGLGVARSKEIRAAFHIVDRQAIDRTLAEFVAEGSLVEVAIDGLREPYYARPETLERALTSPEGARILSPFDGLVIQRERIERLFDFTYTIECYLPAERRTYGYFVLPVLWRDQLVARLDPKADRAWETLQVKGLWFEPGFEDFERALPDLAIAIARYAVFNGCHAVALDRIVPTGHKRALKSLVRSALAAYA